MIDADKIDNTIAFLLAEAVYTLQKEHDTISKLPTREEQDAAWLDFHENCDSRTVPIDDIIACVTSNDAEADAARIQLQCDREQLPAEIRKYRSIVDGWNPKDRLTARKASCTHTIMPIGKERSELEHMLVGHVMFLMMDAKPINIEVQSEPTNN